MVVYWTGLLGTLHDAIFLQEMIEGQGSAIIKSRSSN